MKLTQDARETVAEVVKGWSLEGLARSCQASRERARERAAATKAAEFAAGLDPATGAQPRVRRIPRCDTGIHWRALAVEVARNPSVSPQGTYRFDRGREEARGVVTVDSAAADLAAARDLRTERKAAKSNLSAEATPASTAWREGSKAVKTEPVAEAAVAPTALREKSKAARSTLIAEASEPASTAPLPRGVREARPALGLTSGTALPFRVAARTQRARKKRVRPPVDPVAEAARWAEYEERRARAYAARAEYEAAPLPEDRVKMAEAEYALRHMVAFVNASRVFAGIMGESDREKLNREEGEARARQAAVAGAGRILDSPPHAEGRLHAECFRPKRRRMENLEKSTQRWMENYQYRVWRIYHVLEDPAVYMSAEEIYDMGGLGKTLTERQQQFAEKEAGVKVSARERIRRLTTAVPGAALVMEALVKAMSRADRKERIPRDPRLRPYIKPMGRKSRFGPRGESKGETARSDAEGGFRSGTPQHSGAATSEGEAEPFRDATLRTAKRLPPEVSCSGGAAGGRVGMASSSAPQRSGAATSEGEAHRHSLALGDPPTPPPKRPCPSRDRQGREMGIGRVIP